MKSGFQTELETKLKKGSDGVWIVTAPLKYWDEQLNCLIVIPPWFETENEKDPLGLAESPGFFETDFASVPRVPVAYEAWGNRAHREAVLHDFVYRIDGKINIYSEEARGEAGYRAEGAKVILVRTVTYSEANNLFLRAMISTRKPFRIYFWMWCGVVLCGWTAFHKHYVKDCL